MPTLSFAETLRKNLLVFDGPMGTELYRRHVFTNRCFDELNLAEPKLIEQILTDYRDAGAGQSNQFLYFYRRGQPPY